MKKKAQLTLFLFAGLVLLFAMAGLAMVARNNSHPPSAELEQQADAVRKFVNSCLMQSLLEAEKSGLKETEAANRQKAVFIESELRKCSDFSSFPAKVRAGNPSVGVTVSEGVLAAFASMPITVSDSSSQVKADYFEAFVKRSTAVPLDFGLSGTLSEKVVVTDDRKAQLRIPAETSVMKDGTELTEISLKTMDRNFAGLENRIVVGNLAFEGRPAGATFYPEIELTIFYDDKDIPPGFPEESLVVASFSDASGIWEILPSKVDAANNRITAKVSHFSVFAIVAGCGNSEQVVNLGWLYKEPCYEIFNGEVSGSSPFNCPRWLVRRQGSSDILVSPDKPEASHSAKDGPIYAPKDNQVLKSGQQGSLPQFGVPDSPCLKEKWSSEFESYGYPSVDSVGGTGEFVFSFQGSGNSCSKGFRLDLVCDDSCSVEVNGQQVNGISDRDPIRRIWTFNVPASALKQSNKVKVKVINEYQACSSARAQLVVFGAGISEKCPESKSKDDFLLYPCQCGTKNVNVVYSVAEAQKADFQAILSKKPSSLTDSEKARLKAAVVKEEAQYCFEGEQPFSEEEIALVNQQRAAHKSAFASLVTDSGLADCCVKSRVYPDISAEPGRNGCEIVVCEKSGAYAWAYTGNKLDSSKRRTGTCDKGMGGNVNSLRDACGLKGGLGGGGGSSGIPAPCSGKPGSAGYMSCPLLVKPTIATGAYGSGFKSEHCNQATGYPYYCNPAENPIWAYAIDVEGPDGSHMYDVYLPYVNGETVSWKFLKEGDSKNGEWGWFKEFSASTSQGVYVLRITHTELGNPAFSPGQTLPSGSKVGKLYNFYGQGAGHAHLSVSKDGVPVKEPVSQLGLCASPCTPVASGSPSAMISPGDGTSSAGAVDTSLAQNCAEARLQAFPVADQSSFSNDYGAARPDNAKQGSNPVHEGTDILTKSEGNDVVAANAGEVIRVECRALGGNTISISGNDGFIYYYAHLRDFAVSKGQRVSAGQLIGHVGTTIGCSSAGGIPGQTEPHLHFGIYLPGSGGWVPKNPYCSLKAVQTG